MADIIEDSLQHKRLVQICGSDLVSSNFFRGELTLVIERGALLGICDAIKGDESLRMNHLSDVLGVDYLPASPRFALVYHFYSIPFKVRLRIKVMLDEDETVQSLTPLWKGANCAEREVYDMFGVVFDGHPNLTRIYLADDWVGHPLRKDYPLRGYKDEFNPYGEEPEVKV
ncbi:MAG: NADH-quinone oxidoreductase subunit C [Thermodesulfobacteriota bacterium]